MIAQVGLSCKNHPSLDVPTRWNSTYLMLESSLPFRAAFEALKQADKDYEFAPSASEWEMDEAICHLLGSFYDWDKHLRLKKSHNSNELQQYLKEALFPRRQKLDILKWWEIHSPKYPVLAAIARDILAVSASIVPAEAAFSNAGRVITDHRSSLSPSAVEVLMCLEDWLRSADRQKMETAGGDYGGDQSHAANN